MEIARPPLRRQPGSFDPFEQRNLGVNFLYTKLQVFFSTIDNAHHNTLTFTVAALLSFVQLKFGSCGGGEGGGGGGGGSVSSLFQTHFTTCMVSITCVLAYYLASLGRMLLDRTSLASRIDFIVGLIGFVFVASLTSLLVESYSYILYALFLSALALVMCRKIFAAWLLPFLRAEGNQVPRTRPILPLIERDLRQLSSSASSSASGPSRMIWEAQSRNFW